MKWYWIKYKWKMKFINSWPYVTKKKYHKDIADIKASERIRHDNEIKEEREHLQKLIGSIVKAELERWNTSGEDLYLHVRINPMFVHQFRYSYGSNTRELWKYMAEMMGHEIERQLVTMDFSNIKVRVR